MGASCCATKKARDTSEGRAVRCATPRDKDNEAYEGEGQNLDGADINDENEFTEEELFGKKKDKSVAKELLTEEGRHPFRAAAQDNVVRGCVRTQLYNKMYREMTPPESELEVQPIDVDGAFALEPAAQALPGLISSPTAGAVDGEETTHVGTVIENYNGIGVDPRLANRRKRFLRRKLHAQAAAESISISISRSKIDDDCSSTEDELPMYDGITIQGVQGATGVVEDPLSEDDFSPPKVDTDHMLGHPNVVYEGALIIIDQETPQRTPIETKKFGRGGGLQLLAKAGMLNLSGGLGGNLSTISPRIGDSPSQRSSARPEERERSISRRSAASSAVPISQRFVSFVVVDEREQIAKTQAIAAALMTETTSASDLASSATPPLPVIPPASILVSARGEGYYRGYTPLISTRGSEGGSSCRPTGESEGSGSPNGVSWRGATTVVSPIMRPHMAQLPPTLIIAGLSDRAAPLKPISDSPYVSQLSISPSGNSSSGGAPPQPPHQQQQPTTLSYHVSGEPVAYLTEEVERELVRRSERRKKETAIKATILAQMERHERRSSKDDNEDDSRGRGRRGSSLKERFSSLLRLDKQ